MDDAESAELLAHVSVTLSLGDDNEKAMRITIASLKLVHAGYAMYQALKSWVQQPLES